MSGDSPSMDFKASPWQQYIQSWLKPFMNNMSTGNMPDPAQWEIPDISSMMPGENWWEDLDPNIKAGIREPYTDASNQMLEVMGAKGQTGSAVSPYSGQSQTATGKFWADAGTGMAQQGWGMVSPALQQGWGAELNRNMTQGNQQYQQSMMPYGMIPGMSQQAAPYPMVDPGSPGIGGMLTSMMGPAMMGWGMGGFGNPFGGMGGGMPWSQGSGFNMNPY